jgi:hypothetical protein
MSPRARVQVAWLPQTSSPLAPPPAQQMSGERHEPAVPQTIVPMVVVPASTTPPLLLLPLIAPELDPVAAAPPLLLELVAPTAPLLLLALGPASFAVLFAPLLLPLPVAALEPPSSALASVVLPPHPIATEASEIPSAKERALQSSFTANLQ